MEMIVKDLCSLLKGTETYIVGGYLRNYYLGIKKCNDIDLVTFSPKKKLEEIISKNFKITPINIGPLTKFFLKDKKFFIDIIESNYANIYEDLKNRDFTCNNLALKIDHYPNFKKIIDINKSREDIKKKVIVPVNNTSLPFDPVRILRIYYLKGKFNFHIPLNTIMEIRKNAPLLDSAKGERLKDELKKILKLDNGKELLFQMYLHGVLQILIPPVEKMANIKQNHYHTKNLLIHSFKTLEIFEQNLENLISSSPFYDNIKDYLNEHMVILKLACFLHDIGKIDTSKITSSGKITFYKHEIEAEKYIRTLSNKLKFSNTEKSRLITFVKEHMKPLYLYLNKNITKKNKYKFFNTNKENSLGILLLSLCDYLATRSGENYGVEIENYQNYIFNLIQDYYTKTDELIDVPSLLTGDEIQSILNIPPSPQIGIIKNQLIKQQIIGEIRNKEEAIKYIINKFS
ncbi:Poly A polymerase head domain-containing protein [Anaerobranca californiensis DSM 14826]|jgi:poly(A) polymerase|uniref:Poly A polymerase head domain-containing protein n=1 Tax=Anaerobranca californiensis DSM 14826 TaxID=1120989 RepID=A0A1M6KY19_9FIRM|nr:HD domain-containing protein [Anaerobranca californiensis]SHJ63847.1 Poly A polymerase head domain-containing protein [Anaerobranca californiensis DSM 14826]